jgi:hypothetical protein
VVFRHDACTATILAIDAPQLIQLDAVGLLQPLQTGQFFFQPAIGFFFLPSLKGVEKGSNAAVLDAVNPFFLMQKN